MTATGKDHDWPDNYPAARNKVQAVADVTKLPTLEVAALAEDPVWHKTTPQGSPVSWAFHMVRKHALTDMHALILLALAQHAHAALFSGDGYDGTTAKEVAVLLGQSPVFSGVIDTTLGLYIQPLGLVETSALGSNRWRIPADALDGNWLDHIARLEHYRIAGEVSARMSTRGGGSTEHG